jgi:2-polyprenyl-3-methyl-5-hydroxy-6-metoxy-1,4-benzoquinol methylase
MSSPVPSNWQEFFDLQAASYDQNDFTRNTSVEIQFILKQTELPAGASVLDIGCGTGRHSIKLAEAGFDVTGVDFSEQMIYHADKRARDAGVSPNFIHADFRQYESGPDFDLALCLCEGPINLIGLEEDPVAHAVTLFQRTAAALKPNGWFVFTALNAYSQIRHMTDEDVAAGGFDPTTMVATYVNDMETPVGLQHVYVRERLFFPPEIMAMLHHAGFNLLRVLGGTAGEWGDRPVKLDEIEVLYLARKR